MNRITGVTAAFIAVLALGANSVGAQEISTQMRLLSVNSAVATLDLTLGQLTPPGLTVGEQTEWNSVTAWITESRNRLADFAARAEGGRPNTGARDANRSRGAGLGDPSVLGGRAPGRDSARAGRAGTDTTRAGGAARAGAARGTATDSAARAARAAAPPPNAAAIAQMNTQYLALVADLKAKGGRFQTLSNASKSRHEIAMKAINNLK